jgi:hypothetical protein
MPNPNQFLAGFGITSGRIFGKYELTYSYATHTAIKAYQEYKYNITLTFKSTSKVTDDDYHKFYHLLLNVIRQQHDIKAIRNYYNCTIDDPTNKDITGDIYSEFTYHLTGHSYRD